jgi:ubiquinone/menaquinone biosynthesis C-methylase UbiE
MHVLRGRHRNIPAAFEGRSSRIYDVVARRVLRRIYRRLADDIAAFAPADAALLDIGTGPGVLLVELARRRSDLRLCGVDLSSDMVAAAGRNLEPFGTRASVRVADVTDLPFDDRSFDVIVSSLSLHHWDDPDAAVPELARVLRPGGRLCVYDLRFAPFDRLAAAARAKSLFAAHPPERTVLRAGVPLFPRFVRFVMSSQSS